MIYHKMLLCIAVIACFVVQAYALPAMLVSSSDIGSPGGDWLSPDFVGESMSMPMDPELIQMARAAGIIKDDNPLYKTVSRSTSDYLDAYPVNRLLDEPASMEVPLQAEQAAQDVNVTGPWSLDLIDQTTKYVDLALVQNKGAIMGYGILNAGNNTKKVMASGSESGGRLTLNVMPTDRLDLYKLDLSLDTHTTGTYTAYQADGNTSSGYISGTAPLGILALDSQVPEIKQNPEPQVETAIEAQPWLAKLGSKM